MQDRIPDTTIKKRTGLTAIPLNQSIPVLNQRRGLKSINNTNSKNFSRTRQLSFGKKSIKPSLDPKSGSKGSKSKSIPVNFVTTISENPNSTKQVESEPDLFELGEVHPGPKGRFVPQSPFNQDAYQLMLNSGTKSVFPKGLPFNKIR